MNLFKGMDDNQFWATLWCGIAFLIFLMIACITYAAAAEDRLTHSLVEQGHDPMELACLYNASTHLEMSCFIIAQAKAEIYAKEANLTEDEITKIIDSASTK
jgi:hypothetical protein